MTKRPSVALGFLALVLAGAVALASPWARADGLWGSFSDALFMSCSAVCVTGLAVVDVAATYSRAGQVVLLALVELGCFGIMTCGTFLLVAVGRRLSLSREFSLADAYGAVGLRGLKGLVLWVVGATLLLQAIGAALLYLRLHDAYAAVFYAVMGFCNAGFSLAPGSLASFADDPAVLLVLAAETILGGLGFLVLFNLCTFPFRRRASGARGRLTLHSLVVLRFTLYLIAFAFAAFLALEWNHALAGFAPLQKAYVALYQAVTPRTCGFAVVPTEGLRALTTHVYEALMFFGGGPGSAAGGIKVTTLAVFICTLRAMCRGEDETVISGRTVFSEVVRESFVIICALLGFIWLVNAALSLTEAGRGLAGEALFFESVSAVTTTGLSIGDTTARLSSAGRLVVMCAMFVGRLGALTVVLMIGDRETRRRVRFPNEELVVG